jgi:hypothetical protein
MDEEERIIIIQTMIDNNGIEEGEFAEYEKEALQSLLDSYKFQRRQLNDAFSNGWIHKDKIKEIYNILGEYRHYTTPTIEQNEENENAVDNAVKYIHNLLEEK